MTRGNLAVITKDGVYSSVQFNGDMYPLDGGHGKEAVAALHEVGAGKMTFEEAVAAFNERNFGYDDDPLTRQMGSVEDAFASFGIGEERASDAYFRDWHSDYVYVLNASGKTARVGGVDVRDGVVATFRFGTFESAERAPSAPSGKRSVTVNPETTKNPYELMGECAGECWGAPTHDAAKNAKRGASCVSSGHGRVVEYPQVFLKIEGYSARVIRELYTHIGGAPTRLQASTRYVDYESGFDYVAPKYVMDDPKKLDAWIRAHEACLNALQELENLGIKREDCALHLPLGMTSVAVLRTNARNLVDMSRQRLCSRANWEFRDLMKDIGAALSDYSEEWKKFVSDNFKAKCEVVGWCEEERCCGRAPKKSDVVVVTKEELEALKAAAANGGAETVKKGGTTA